MIYLDTSALTKLLVVEPETAALRSWLAERADYPVTSALGRVELMRAVVRQGKTGHAERASQLLDGVDIMPLAESVLTLAETVGPPTLRSLDAIHVASALCLGAELTAVVAYDHRLLDGCRQAGVPTASPGADNAA